MLQQKGFADDCARAARSHGSDHRDDQMSHQDEPISHTANDDRGWRPSQGYEPIADCAKLSIRHGQGNLSANKQNLGFQRLART